MMVATMTISQRIGQLRREKKLTQHQLASQSELSVSAIRKYEQGISEPSIRSLIKIASAFKITLDELVEGVDFPEE
jgi:transcriptional regulator with XRE-family HTH domain